MAFIPKNDLNRIKVNRVVFTFLLMCGLIVFLHILSIPAPEAVLLTALVLVCGVLGYQSGIVCAVLEVMYFLHYYSDGHDFISFTSENLLKVIVILVCVAVNIAFIKELRENWEFTRKKLTGANRNLRQYNQVLREETMVDELTGMYNRAALRLHYPRYTKKNLIVTFVDLDDFKKINDIYGHKVGDKALQEVSRALQVYFKNTNCYRYGGDEFLLIRTDDNWQNYEMEILRLRAHIATIVIADGAPPIHLSGGYVIGMPERDTDLREMFHQADEMLYESKRKGKNCFTGNMVIQAGKAKEAM